MSLRVWLPLTGTLENKGISNIIPTNVNATVNSSGKIGSCYNFAGSGQRIKMTNPITNGINSFSICTWFYMTAASEALFGARTSGSGAGLLCFLYDDRILFDDGARFTCNYNVNNLLNSWHHIACVKTPTQKIIYIDGVSIGSQNTTATTATIKNEITIGNDSYEKYTGNDLIGKLNDFRIYDHCLSAAEVHEISQGLVLHYKLDDNIQTLTNAFNMGSWNTNTASGGFSVWGPSGHSGSRGTNTDRQYIYSPDRSYSYWIAHGANTDTSKYYIFYQSPAFDGGYRSLSCIVKEENSLPIDDAWFMPGWNADVPGPGHAAKKWTHIYPLGNGFYLCQVDGLYQDGSNDLVCLTINNGHKVYISEIWLEDNRQVASNPLAQSTTMQVQDSSGYGHNGTIEGNISLDNNTPRYLSATHFQPSSGIFNNINITFDSFTISFWAKHTAQNKMLIGSNASISNKNTNWYWYGDNSFKYASGEFYYTHNAGTSEALLGTWIHFVATYDGSVITVYRNGVKEGTKAASGSMLMSYVSVGNGYTGTSYWAEGYVSDFRIYCTALSANDILSLYHTAAKVDNLSNVHSFEFIEDNMNKLYKTGIFKENQFSEINGISNLKYDLNTYFEPDGSIWVHIFHHVNPTSNKFSSGNTFTTGVYIDANRWFNFDLCNYIDKWEFIAAVTRTSTDTLERYRWVQSTNPLTATFDQTKVANVTRITTGYNTSPLGGLYHVSGSTWLAANNGTNNNWFGATGCWTAWNGGIPGWKSTAAGDAVTTGTIDIYVRIDNLNNGFPANAKLTKNNILIGKQFIER